MENKQLTIKDTSYNIEKISDMQKMAIILKNHIVKNKLFTNIQGKNYAHVDGWAVAGGLMGIYPKVTKVENLSNDKERKWKADVEIIRIKDNLVMSQGFALCSSAENKKRVFDEYAILSTAQTRAIGKAYRNLIGWVMKLGGMEATPAEEMKSTPTDAEIKAINKKPAIDKLAKAKNKVELQNVWRTLSQTERNHPDIIDYKDELKEKYANS